MQECFLLTCLLQCITVNEFSLETRQTHADNYIFQYFINICSHYNQKIKYSINWALKELLNVEILINRALINYNLFNELLTI